MLSFNLIYSCLSSLIFYQLGLSPLLFCEDHSPEQEQQEKSAPQDPSSDSPKLLSSVVEAKEELEVKSKPRLCVVQKSHVGFGFHLGWVQHKPGTFINQV